MTSTKRTKPLHITYGDGSSIAGVEFTDSISIAGITVKNQSFSSATRLSYSLGDDPNDGIFGLAYPSISRLKSPTFLTKAFEQGLIPSTSFSFKLSSEGSELFLGGADKTKYSGQVEKHPVTRKAYWQIGGASVYINGVRVGRGGYQTVIDSGTTIMYGPEAVVEAIYKRVNGSARYQSVDGLWTFPCQNAPRVSFSWGGKKWAIAKDRVILGKKEENPSECIGSISSQTVGLGRKTWLLGDSFMASVYSVFDPIHNTVGFATPK